MEGTHAVGRQPFMPDSTLSRRSAALHARLAKYPSGNHKIIPRIKKKMYIVQGKVPSAELEPFRTTNLQTNQSPQKYRLNAAPAIEFPGGELRIVSQKEFPIQNSLTGATMLLKPGALREMHWHPNADEWQLYLSGRARVTIFGAHGRTKTEEFGPGEVAFIKQGFGHCVQQIGDEPTKVLILLKSPVYEEINISTWLAANPVAIIADNFGITKELVDRLPKKSIVIAAPQVGSSSST